LEIRGIGFVNAAYKILSLYLDEKYSKNQKVQFYINQYQETTVKNLHHILFSELAANTQQMAK
jgi:hypothetical protein